MSYDWETLLLAYMHWLVIFMVVATVWSGVWKGIALWRAGRNNHLVWYICIFIFNTLGILEIIYIFAFSRKKAAAMEPAA